MNPHALAVLTARLALAAGFLSAVADRFGWWGPLGTPDVGWGNMSRFIPYVAQLNPWLPLDVIPAVGWGVTIAEIVLGVMLLVGVRLRAAAVLSGCMLVAFAIGMVAGRGVKSAFNASVPAAAAAAFLLALMPPDPWSVDGHARAAGRRQRSR